MWSGNDDTRLQKSPPVIEETIAVEERHFRNPEKRFTTNCPYANLRSKPSPEASVVTQIACKIQVDVLGYAPSLSDQQYKWYHIRTKESIEGWIFAGENDTWLQTSIPEGENIGIIATETDPLRIREGPGEQYDIIARVPKGAEVIIEDDSGVWYKIRLLDGSIGYGHSDYIKHIDN